MRGCISYSLFGYGKDTYNDCFDFFSFLRCMHICIRFNRILFPGWDIIINTDSATYNSPYKKIFDWHINKGFIKIKLFENNQPLCRAMLQRLKPIFEYDHPNFRYSHVLCRDLDSISTFREAQMVKQWIDEDKTMLCITDSISHNIPILGGMCGFSPGYFNGRMQLTLDPEYKWDELMSRVDDIDYSRKGSDQDFLNRIIYPICAESSTEFFIKGMPHNLAEGNGRHYVLDESIDIGIDDKFKQTNLLAGHIGASGFYEFPTMKFLYYEDPYKDDYTELENMEEFRSIFYWVVREDLR